MHQHDVVARRRDSLTARLSQPLGHVLGSLGYASSVTRPVLVIGSHRSGTSVLASILGAHPDIAYFPVEASELWFAGVDVWRGTRREGVHFWTDPALFMRFAVAQQRAVDIRRLRATFRVYQTIRGGRHFLNKNPFVSLVLAHALDVLPGVRFVHIVRDGRAVAVSLAQKIRYRLAERRPPLRTGPAFDVLVEESARYWNTAVLSVEHQKEALGLQTMGSLIELRYEDLCANPADSLGRIAEFMGLDPAWLGEQDLSRLSSRNQKWQERIDADLRTKIEGIMEPALAAKGYVWSSSRSALRVP